MSRRKVAPNLRSWDKFLRFTIKSHSARNENHGLETTSVQLAQKIGKHNGRRWVPVVEVDDAAFLSIEPLNQVGIKLCRVLNLPVCRVDLTREWGETLLRYDVLQNLVMGSVRETKKR